MVKAAGAFLFGFILHIGALLSTVIAFCFTIPLMIGFSFLLELVHADDTDFLFVLSPNLAMMLLVYSIVWLIAIRCIKFAHASAIFFSGGALLLNLFMLYLYFSSGESFKELATDWNNEGCGPFPAALVFLCFCYSTVLLPAYIYCVRRWVLNSGDQWKKRLLQVFAAMVVLLFALVMATFGFVQ
ncbi:MULTISPECIES: hypothetical protein [Bacillus]|uniref:Uncharacterized protein n=2 Tax=Bacillus TaxID=1386 RepID=A0A0M4FIP0_9BACI|nr:MULTISPECIES: hypothetical protein [Bacillus]ALC82799.1 hypothetical protein AM592_15310 [Bacillus gobiensis]MBP1081761.1 hypothetical protein [Bacillus capparidis]MED1096412.1 hypothetical protein [Bacillus capparidis]